MRRGPGSPNHCSAEVSRPGDRRCTRYWQGPRRYESTAAAGQGISPADADEPILSLDHAPIGQPTFPPCFQLGSRHLIATRHEHNEPAARAKHLCHFVGGRRQLTRLQQRFADDEVGKARRIGQPVAGLLMDDNGGP